MKSAKEDFYDSKLKAIAGQRVKHYLFDAIRVLNVLAAPVHYYKRKKGTFNNICVNLGCGPSYLANWLNVDGNPVRKKDLWLDLRRRWPFPDKSINGLVAAHVIEHLFDEELDHFFRELQRVMKINGFIHIEVPSFELLVARYSEDHDGSYANRIIHWYGAHHQVFDFDRLRNLLSLYGFQEFSMSLGERTSRYLTQQDLHEICLRPEESLIVEALKK